MPFDQSVSIDINLKENSYFLLPNVIMSKSQCHVESYEISKSQLSIESPKFLTMKFPNDNKVYPIDPLKPMSEEFFVHYISDSCLSVA